MLSTSPWFSQGQFGALFVFISFWSTSSTSHPVSSTFSGAALPVDSNLNECTPTWVTANDPTWPNCLGGAGRRAAFVSNMISSNPYTIVLDGGSAFWGGFMCTHFHH
jgi:hypothetical protein